MITIRKLQRLNAERAKRWHNNDEEPWILTDWTNALAGEAGEACNAAKKIRRITTKLPNKEAGLDKSNLEELKQHVGKECADTILYAILTIDFLGLDAQQLIADVFNKKSEEYGFPERVEERV